MNGSTFLLLNIFLLIVCVTARRIPNSYILRAEDGCTSSGCLNSIKDAAQAAGCRGASVKQLRKQPKNRVRPNSNFLNIRCQSRGSAVTSASLTASIRNTGVLVGDVGEDLIARAFVSWNIDEVDSTPTDGQRCATSQLGTGVEVIVLDTGCTPTAGAYCDNFVGGAGSTCVDGNGHGTAAASNVADAMLGVAPKAAIGCGKVLGDDGSGSYSGVIAGLNSAADYASTTGKTVVINMSLGGPRDSNMDSAITAASSSAVIILAAGNENQDANNVSPAAAGDNVRVFTIGAHDESGNAASFTNFGDVVKISAPGVNVRVKTLTGEANWSGTSFSAPHVAGATAALLSDGKTVTLNTLLTGTATVPYRTVTQRFNKRGKAVGKPREGSPVAVKKLSYSCS